MDPHGVMLGMMAVADLTLLAHLRLRQGRRLRMERMMASLCMAVRLENDRESLFAERPGLRAS
jgi:hypothetical protein